MISAMFTLHFIVLMSVFTSLQAKKNGTKFFDRVMTHLAEVAGEERHFLSLGEYDDVFTTPTETLDYLKDQFQVSLAFAEQNEMILRKTYKVRNIGHQELVDFLSFLTSLPFRIMGYERAKDLQSDTKFYPTFSAGIKNVQIIALLRDLAEDVISTTKRFRGQVTKIRYKEKEVLKLLSRTQNQFMAEERSTLTRLVEGVVDTDTLGKDKGLYQMTELLFSHFMTRIFTEEVLEVQE